jgi:hypothetical protein
MPLQPFWNHRFWLSIAGAKGSQLPAVGWLVNINGLELDAIADYMRKAMVQELDSYEKPIYSRNRRPSNPPLLRETNSLVDAVVGMAFPGPIPGPFIRQFVVRRVPPRPRAPPNRQVEIARAMARKRGAGDDYNLIIKRLGEILRGDMTKPTLVAFAEKIAAIKSIKVDRQAIRAKDSLICWFCENCKDVILAYGRPNPPLPPVPQDPKIDPSCAESRISEATSAE